MNKTNQKPKKDLRKFLAKAKTAAVVCAACSFSLRETQFRLRHRYF